jgi:hypothetical protein
MMVTGKYLFLKGLRQFGEIAAQKPRLRAGVSFSITTLIIAVSA